MPGEGEEHVVQAGLAQGDRHGHDAFPVKGGEHAHQGPWSFGDVQAHQRAVSLRVTAPEAGEQGLGPPRLAIVGEADLHRGGAEAGLELAGRALGDHAPSVDDRDAVGEAVGLLQVLGGEHQRGALPHQLPDQPPQLHSAPGVQPGGGLVQE
jgi:hypothetical protein